MKLPLLALVGIPVMLGSSSLYAQPDLFAKFAKATRIYSCHYFIKASAEASSEPSQREKLQRISNTILTQASNIALDTGGQSLNEKISRQGEANFQKFMNDALQLPTEAERNERFASFMRSCAAESGVEIK